ncbi:MAG TPA: c-type cytochrome [Gemmatimonadaceae bacterium]|jgi:tetratricopeptide (TPR) repeat protein
MRLCFLALLLASPATLTAQLPATFENLQYFPKDIPRDTLIQIMRGFSFALGVRCQYCHAGGDGISFEGVEFKSDEKVAKRKARYMLHMADTINNQLLAGLPNRSTPPVRVACVTCHRGLSKPATLASTLTATIESTGTDSAVAQYRRLRQNTMTQGTFDFGEWSMNELARTLGERGKTMEAIAMLELNQEFYPQAAEIDFMIAELHLQRGEKDKAISRYRAVLEKQPNNARAKQRLIELGAT